MLRAQLIGVRDRAQRVAPLRVARLIVGYRHEPFGRLDLGMQRRARDRRRHDVGGQRAARSIELIGLHVHARSERRIGETRGAEQVERVVRLQLTDEDVVQERVRTGLGDRQRTIAGGLAAQVDGRQHRTADLRAQLLASGSKALVSGGERRAVAQAFVDQRVQRIRLIELPPFGYGLRADHELLGNALGGHGLRRLRFGAVVGRLRHGGRLAIRAKRAGGQRQRGAAEKRKAQVSRGCCKGSHDLSSPYASCRSASAARARRRAL